MLSLGHNLIVHDPDIGLSYLRLLHDSADLAEERHRNASTRLRSPPENRVRRWPLANWLQRVRIGAPPGPLTCHKMRYLSSEKPILKCLAGETLPSIKVRLIWSLAMIGDPGCLPEIRDVVEHATDDEVQAAAIFTFADLAGFDGIGYLRAVKPRGAKSMKEQEDSVAWLKAETRPDLKHGRDVSNDPDFADRFGDLRSSSVMRGSTPKACSARRPQGSSEIGPGKEEGIPQPSHRFKGVRS